MALDWCHEADGAVAMLVVVPVRQFGDPAPCAQQVLERLDRQLGRYFSVLNADST